MSDRLSHRAPQVFLSYRRRDSLVMTGRIYDKLSDRLGVENVFMDFDDIPLGVDFRQHLRDSLNKCDVLVVVIGPNWVGRGADGDTPRIQDPDDFVRIEVEMALGRDDIPVIPLLVGDTSMPSAEQLPEELRPLVYRQAATVDVGPDFHVHMERLIKALQSLAPEDSEVPDPEQPGIARRILSFAHGRQGAVLSAWAAVGAITGALSAVVWSNLGGWGGPTGVLGYVIAWLPSVAFGAALCVVEEMARAEVIRRWSAVVSRPLLILGSCGAFYLALVVLNEIEDMGGSDLEAGVAAGAVGAALLTLVLLGLWRTGRGRWRWAAMVVGAGAILGTSTEFAMNSESPFLVLIPWQAGVLAVVALAPVSANGGVGTDPASNGSFTRFLRRAVEGLSGKRKTVVVSGFAVIVAGVLAFTMVESGPPTGSDRPATLRVVRCTNSQPSSSDDTKTGTIMGEVLSADEGLSPAGIQVFLPEGQMGTIVSENGQFRISEVPEGLHIVRARSSVYGSAECGIYIGGGVARATFSVNRPRPRR